MKNVDKRRRRKNIYTHNLVRSLIILNEETFNAQFYSRTLALLYRHIWFHLVCLAESLTHGKRSVNIQLAECKHFVLTLEVFQYWATPAGIFTLSRSFKRDSIIFLSALWRLDKWQTFCCFMVISKFINFCLHTKFSFLSPQSR